jgi:hypothetical protein
MFDCLTTDDDFNFRTPTNNASIELKKKAAFNNNGYELKNLLKCPFCGGVVSEHPNKKYRDCYFVIYHDTNCYMNAGNKPPINFTLLPKNYCLEQWNRRIYHHF